MATRSVELKRGLKDVYLDRTQASFIDGTEGKLLYRGYNIHDLAEKSTFEEVAYLLLYGSLPTQEQLDGIDAMLKSSRTIPEEVYRVIELTKDGHPMDVLRTAVSALASFDPDVEDNSADAVRRKGLRLTSQAATIICAHYRMREGLQPVAPHESLSHAGNFLYMMRGEVPDEDEAKLMDVDFILHAEHGANASSFASRVTASTLADLHAAVVTGVGTLKGPLHGGAAESVMKMAEEIGDPAEAKAYARRVLEGKGRIMGFGHRVYRAEDPRAQHLRDRSKALGEKLGQPQWIQILDALVEAMAPYRARGIHVNVDFFAGSIYHLMDIPEDLFIPIFALGRIPGWTLQVLEQFENNILIRPLLWYEGPMDLEYVPMEARA
ncbi:MAG: citrate (Si)-synthase [Chloroflexi bacterium]|nr:citrate (Si)-synthase [Chloroflexota bacterium]